jgi:hypothetical protein
VNFDFGETPAGLVGQNALSASFKVRQIIDIAIMDSLRKGLSPLRYLTMENGPRRRTGARWNPSSLTGCIRKSVYKAHGVKGEPLEDVDKQFIFDRGTVMGLWIAAYFRAAEDAGIISNVKAQVSDREELLVFDKDLSLGGFVDVQFEANGSTYLVEVKSKDNAKAMDRIKSADKKHLRQLNEYMAMAGVVNGWIVYFGLTQDENGADSFSILEFPHRFSSSLWEESKRDVAGREALYAAPDRLGASSTNARFECPGCPYRKPCRAMKTPLEAKQ